MRPVQPRAMYPGEFVSTLWAHKHSRFNTCGVESNRWGHRVRKDVGLPEHGTIWFAETGDFCYARGAHRTDGKDFHIIVPANCIPFESVGPPREHNPLTGRKETNIWNPDTHRFRGDILKGWRQILRDLATGGYFAPSEELSALIGKDSFKEIPRRYWE